MAAKKPRATKNVKAIKHGKQSRSNIPTVEMEGLVKSEEKQPVLVRYPRNRDLDPQLLWKGKDEENQDRLIMEALPIYVQEKIHPQAIIDDLRRRTAERRQQETGAQPNLFGDFNGLSSEKSQVEFYRHRQKWTNRMILGDSLMVMASLAYKEGLKGQVQCVYIDPPYGIKFPSNWQTSTKSTAVSDKDETRQPEMIQAFRDTWKGGVHSYLSYLRDRLTVAHDLLAESGSVFVQIGDENVHLVALLMDEVFGAENRMATISYATTSGSSASHLPQVSDYLLWYGKNRKLTKYRQLYEELDRKEIIDHFSSYAYLQMGSGVTRKLTNEERENPNKYIPAGARIFKRTALDSQGVSTTGRSEIYTWRKKKYACGKNRQWSISKEGMDRMDKAGRLHALPDQDSMSWRRYEREVPGKRINNLWPAQMYPSDKRYVVQTSDKVIQRCLLMTTDPGDLVLDSTCGSGTTASVAEQWGRRWITIDTSRVAMAIARARLMGNQYDYYLMQDSEVGAKMEVDVGGKPLMEKQYTDDVRHGFVYHRVNTLSPNDFAKNVEIDIIWEEWQKSLLPLQKEFNKVVGKKHEEWEIPLEAAEDWSDAVRKVHAKWCKARMDRQKEIDASIARNAKTELLVDRPYTAPNTVRVTGPFTVESLSPYRIVPTDATDDQLLAVIDAEAEQEGETPPKRQSRRLRPKSETVGETRFINIIHENLKTAGIQNTRKGESRLDFSELKPPPMNSRCIQFSGHYREDGKDKKAAIVIGPEYGTVTRSFVVAAALEAVDMFHLLVVIGFAFEPNADENRIGDMQVRCVRMNNDLHMANHLKAKSSDNLFVVFGEPDIEVTACGDDFWKVEIKGLDIFDPTTGEVKPGGVEDIACWMIDTDYNGESFFARHVYFTGGGKDPYKDLKRSLKAEIDEADWLSLTGRVSRPFAKPSTGRIAVKAINHYGDEVIRVFEIK